MLHAFRGGTDGAGPEGALIGDASGNLYSTTAEGGVPSCSVYRTSGCGTVFKLVPPAAGQTKWTENVIHRFEGGADGALASGQLYMDVSGALYGTTYYGGNNGSCTIAGNSIPGCGTIFEVEPPAAGAKAWTERVIYSLAGGGDGVGPNSPLIADSTGALYTTIEFGGDGFGGGDCPLGCGRVVRLSPPAAGAGTWTETTLYAFSTPPDGSSPIGGLVMDPSGALYGTTFAGGGGNSENCPRIAGGYPPGCGTVFSIP